MLACILYLSLLLWVFLSPVIIQGSRKDRTDPITTKPTPQKRNSRVSTGQTSAQVAVTVDLTSQCWDNAQPDHLWLSPITTEIYLWLRLFNYYSHLSSLPPFFLHCLYEEDGLKCLPYFFLPHVHVSFVKSPFSLIVFVWHTGQVTGSWPMEPRGLDLRPKFPATLFLQRYAKIIMMILKA
jgi:hypothetical protein